MVEKTTKKSNEGTKAKAKPSEGAKTTSKRSKKKPQTDGKSRKKLWLILGSVLGGVVAAGLVVWAIVLAVIENQPLEQDWAQTYYVYLDENKLNPEVTNDEEEISFTADEYELGFYPVEGLHDPIMAVNYVTDDDNYLSYYWVSDNEVQNAYIYAPSEIVFLYNMDTKLSEYYIHYEADGVDYYNSLHDAILGMADADDPNHVSAEPEYKFVEKDITSVKDSGGKEYSLTKFEETFVEVEGTTETTTLPVDYDKNTLKRAVKDEAYEYKVLEEIAQKHADMINQAVADVEKRKSEISRVEKENAEIEAQKKAAEEAKRKAEEAAKGIQLEGYTIAYGTYLLDEDFIGPTNGEYTLVLKPDGVCTYGGKPCTWTLGERDYAQDVSTAGKHIHKSIFIHMNSGDNYGTSLFAYSDNELGDGDIEHYTYAGY